MACRTLLLSLNDVPRAAALTDAAITLAQAQDAHLIACYVIPAIIVYPEVGFSAVPGVFDGHQVYFKTHLAAVRKLFEAKTAAAGVKSEWRAVESVFSQIAPTLLEHGRATDLIIASQIAEDPKANIEMDLVERLVMEAGRPVLMIPQTGSFILPKTAVLGYNATRESARALFDSVPLLKSASDVRVIWVDPQAERSAAGDVPGAEAAAALARHGIKATAEGLAAGGADAGAALLQRANDLGADLVVMGAYAHSRMREYIFGGATQHVLENARVPVLLSH